MDFNEHIASNVSVDIIQVKQVHQVGWNAQRAIIQNMIGQLHVQFVLKESLIIMIEHHAIIIQVDNI